MELYSHWIKGGQIIEPPRRQNGSIVADRILLFQQDFVKVECGPTGTNCKWVMFGANWLSLYFLSEFMVTMTAPYTLEFFNAGWFLEKFDSVTDARQRLEQLISKSDIRFSSRTFTRTFSPSQTKMTKNLRAFWDSGEIDLELKSGEFHRSPIRVALATVMIRLFQNLIMMS
jgi:hypothetical protein